MQLPALRVADIVADARWLHHFIGAWLPALRAFGKAGTDAFQQAQFGTAGTLVLPVFTPPPLPAGDPLLVPPLPDVAVRPEGALTRIFDLIAEIKENDLCTPAMCSDLGIIGAEEGAPDLANLRPEITAVVSGNLVKILWTWLGLSKWLDLCEIQVDRGTGWQPLAMDTTPNYDDTAPHPATPTQWKYRAIFRAGENQVGAWSLTATVVVGG